MSFILESNVFETLDATLLYRKGTFTNIWVYSRRVYSDSVGTHGTHKLPVPDFAVHTSVVNPTGRLVLVPTWQQSSASLPPLMKRKIISDHY